jgi:hypothetical protein
MIRKAERLVMSTVSLQSCSFVEMPQAVMAFDFPAGIDLAAGHSQSASTFSTYEKASHPPGSPGSPFLSI